MSCDYSGDCPDVWGHRLVLRHSSRHRQKASENEEHSHNEKILALNETGKEMLCRVMSLVEVVCSEFWAVGRLSGSVVSK